MSDKARDDSVSSEERVAIDFLTLGSRPEKPPRAVEGYDARLDLDNDPMRRWLKEIGQWHDDDDDG